MRKSQGLFLIFCRRKMISVETILHSFKHNNVVSELTISLNVSLIVNFDPSKNSRFEDNNVLVWNYSRVLH